ncbi:MAG: hypothetical protein GEV08_13355 [Acidimicrobiia bacterium]|nr:hypothetical protein [Acidimicrobiia bacterium]
MAVAAGAAPDGFAAAVASLSGLWAGLVGTWLVGMGRQGPGRFRNVVGVRLTAQDVLVGVPAGLLAQLVVVPLLTLPVRLLQPDRDLSAEARDLLDRADGAALVVLVVLVVVASPIIEELFFRGPFQRTAVRRFPRRRARVFGALAQHYGRQGPAVIAHVAFNATTVTALQAEWV